MTSGNPKGWKRNHRYDHAFAIMRVDLTHLMTHPQDAITVTKVLWSKSKAERECERLNQLIYGKDVIYLCNVTRVERRGEVSSSD